jgi:hypothetical protein
VAGVDDPFVEASREGFWTDPAAYGVVDPDAADSVAQWLSHFRDATLLVLAVVAHGHGVSTREVRRATGQLRVSVVE